MSIVNGKYMQERKMTLNYGSHVIWMKYTRVLEIKYCLTIDKLVLRRYGRFLHQCFVVDCIYQSKAIIADMTDKYKSDISYTNVACKDRH